MSTTTVAIVWPPRAKVSETDVAIRRQWTSQCGQFRVTHSRYTVGTTDRYADRFYAEAWTTNGWDILSTHRKEKAAFRACERASRL